MSVRRPFGPPRYRATTVKWVAWGTGAAVFFLAIFHRTSLGVAGPLAADRFTLNASQLSSFIMLQIAVYAAMQVPAGLLIDRKGPYRALLVACALMAGAQIGFALVTSYPAALIARGVLGCGDSLTYLSVLRLLTHYFPRRRYASLTAVTGIIGTLGNVTSTLPLTLLFDAVGWTMTFLIAGSLSAGYGLVLMYVMPDPFASRHIRSSPAATTTSGPGESPGSAGAAGRVPRPGSVWVQLVEIWRTPGSRVAFWIHFSTMAGPQAFAVLWGYPYMVEGLGYSPTKASALLLMLVALGAVGNIVTGLLLDRLPRLRITAAAITVTVCTADWVLLAVWPGGHVPLLMLIIILVSFAIIRPSSIIGFLVVRDHNPADRVSTATGFVNMGGHSGTVVAVYLIGQMLDLTGATAETHSLDSYRWAFAAVAVLTGIGLWRLLTWWYRTRRLALPPTRGDPAIAE